MPCGRAGWETNVAPNWPTGPPNTSPSLTTLNGPKGFKNLRPEPRTESVSRPGRNQAQTHGLSPRGLSRLSQAKAGNKHGDSSFSCTLEYLGSLKNAWSQANQLYQCRSGWNTGIAIIKSSQVVLKCSPENACPAYRAAPTEMPGGMTAQCHHTLQVFCLKEPGNLSIYVTSPNF